MIRKKKHDYREEITKQIRPIHVYLYTYVYPLLMCTVSMARFFFFLISSTLFSIQNFILFFKDKVDLGDFFVVQVVEGRRRGQWKHEQILFLSSGNEMR